MITRDPNPIRSVASFFLGAVTISWSCWLLVIAVEHGLLAMPGGTKELLVVVGTYGPLFSALAMAAKASGRPGVQALLAQALRWKVQLRWYAAALFLPALVRFAVVAAHTFNGGNFPGMTDLDRWLAVPSTFLLVLVLGGPLGEEFGWRGYSQPRLQTGFGILGSSLIIGTASAMWHLPLFFIAATPQSHLPFALFLLRTVALSVVSGWLWNRSGRGLLLVLLFHASLNTWPDALFIVEAKGTLGPYINSTLLYVAWAVALVLLDQLSARRSVVKARREASQQAA